MAHTFNSGDLRQIWIALQSNVSNQNPISVTIDITGNTVIDMTGNDYADIVILTSSNATETIAKIINSFSNKEIVFQPESGLSVEFNNKSAMTPGSNIRLYTDKQTTNGTKAGYIALKRRIIDAVVDFFEIDFMDEYY